MKTSQQVKDSFLHLVHSLDPRTSEEWEKLRVFLCEVQDGCTHFLEMTSTKSGAWATQLKEELLVELENGPKDFLGALEEAIEIHCAHTHSRLSPTLIDEEVLEHIRSLQKVCLARQTLYSVAEDGR